MVTVFALVQDVAMVLVMVLLSHGRIELVPVMANGLKESVIWCLALCAPSL